MTVKNKPFRFSIRSKLLLLSITFLLVPYTAYRSLLELETSLRQGLESSLLDVGHSLSAFLSTRDDLLRHDISYSEQYLFIHDLKYPVLLDGYGDEWSELVPWSNHYKDNSNILFSYWLTLGRHDKSLYILLNVKDDDHIFHDPGELRGLSSDHVSMIFKNNHSEMIRYELAPEAPGRLFPFRLDKYWLHEQDIGLGEPDLRKVFITNIQAYWQRTDTGYSVEIEVPWHLVPDMLGVVVHDIDTMDQKMVSIPSFDSGDENYPNRLIQQSQELNSIINSLGVTKNRRIWVLDTLGQVVAVDGSLKAGLKKSPVNIIYEIILPKTHERFNDDLTDASRLEGEEIQTALNGASSTRWRSSIDDKVVILSAAVPIKKLNQVVGLVVVEETTNSIQLLKRDALTNLFNKTLLVFFLVTILLLMFASYLSLRLRRLSQEANNAIDEHGRVVGEISVRESNDELGELTKNYKNILQRLKQYHDYLEGMAGKLSHELRTPMAVVQSSLENLEVETDQKASSAYLQRAKDGIAQLNQLVTRLSEVSRIEQSLQNSEIESIEIVGFMNHCVAAYRDVFTPVEFHLKTELEQQTIDITPDLIVQMLDKLVANAVDFHIEGSPIEIALVRSKQSLYIDVINQGSLLPEEMQTQLFQSMISKRDSAKKDEPHLGLGLYIVRLIAEFHSGTAEARNLANGQGVSFQVRLPLYP